jgi:DNA invertase Pin-like site-specific DNA recombinase
MRAAIYARVSTADKQDPEMQTREITEFCERRGWKNPAVMVDRMSSGKIRPELEKLKALCRRRKFDVVVVYRFDRFARSSVELLTALEEFRTLGIDFVSLHENVDTTTAQGKLMFAIIAAFAEFERSIIRERVISGLALAKSKGVRLGRPRRDPDLATIRALRSQGRSWRHIASLMGVPVTTVRRALLVGQKTATQRVQ